MSLSVMITKLLLAPYLYLAGIMRNCVEEYNIKKDFYFSKKCVEGFLIKTIKISVCFFLQLHIHLYINF